MAARKSPVPKGHTIRAPRAEGQDQVQVGHDDECPIYAIYCILFLLLFVLLGLGMTLLHVFCLTFNDASDSKTEGDDNDEEDEEEEEQATNQDSNNVTSPTTAIVELSLAGVVP